MAAIIVAFGGIQTARAETLTVAYFLEWPMPFQYAKVNGLYEDALGVDIAWRAFDTGTAMTAAMASGDVQIAISQGVPPFVVAVSAGQDLQAVDVAVSYSDNDNCVVQSALEISADNAKELEGKRVAVPVGTAAHYGFLKQMAHFGIDTSTMSIIDMAPPDSAAAFAQGSLDMACGWGGSLRKMKEFGNTLLTGVEKEALGIRVFDVTSVSASFAAENPDMLAQFLKITAEMNARYRDDAEDMLPVIARDAGMDRDAARETLRGFRFLTPQQQLSEDWLGGGTQIFLKEVADFFQMSGNIDAARDDYDDAVNTEPLRQAAGL
ncbi:MAG: ABC transporter substrate-binding protein [Pseudomonadota bacterium]